MRASQGLGLEEHRDQVARMWSGFSQVAAGNPHAWGPAPVTAEEFREPSAKNKPIAHPYLKLHNSNWNVDQAAGLILCSVEAARAHGIPEERWVFPLSATESNHMVPLAARAELHRSRGVAIGGSRALELAGPARVAGYTVLFLGETATKGIAVCDLPDGRRTVANSEDAELVARMTSGEFCGRELEVAADGVFRAI